MGVYIKGMDEIPEDGAVLVVMHDNGKAYIKYACTYGYSMELVNVPEPHGRLIDETIVLEMIRKSMGIKDLSFLYHAEKSVVNEIFHAPTVIEAEGER